MRWPSPPLPPVTTATLPLRSIFFSLSFSSMRSEAEQLRRRAAQYRDPLGVAQTGRRQHEVDLGAGPRERIVGADHDLAGAGLGDQVAQRFRSEHDRVEEQLAVAQVLRRLLLRERADAIGEGALHRV